MNALIVAGALIAFVLFVVLPTILIIVTEYERAVFFRLGRIREGAKGPGIVVRFPLIDRVVKVSLRVEVVDIPAQAAITADNVTVQVDAVVSARTRPLSSTPLMRLEVAR